MKHFYINDTSKLEEYGFHAERNSYMLGKTHWIYVKKDTGRIKGQISSAAFYAICRLVKDGLIEIVDEEKENEIVFQLTGEEIKLIRELRKQKENKTNE